MRKFHLFFLSSFFCVVSITAQNYALQFSTPKQYMEINAMDIPAPWTTELWIKKTAATMNSSIMTSVAFKLNLETYASSGKIGITKNGNADFTFNYRMPIDTWTHIAYTCDGKTTRLYVNGVLKDTVDAFIKAPMNTLNSLTEGSLAIVDEVRVWNFAKTKDDIFADMNHPVSETSLGLVGYWKFDDKAIQATDYSIADHDGTIHGATYVANDNGLFYNQPIDMVFDKAVCSNENEFMVKPGSTNQEILCIAVKTTGTENPKIVSSIRITPEGTTNLADVTNAKIYYTGLSNVFSTNAAYGKAMPIAANMNFAADQVLENGINYFWITYDVPFTAISGNKIDASCMSIVVKGMGEVITASNNPIGNRTVQSIMPAKAKVISVIPRPVTLVENPGIFTLTKNTKIIVKSGTHSESFLLASYLRKATGYAFPIKKDGSGTNNISLEILNPKNSTFGNEGYSLNVTSSGIIIKANTSTGVFYGIQTLRQLLPKEINSRTVVTNVEWNCPNVSITDYPRFAWRGFMLDVSRHFFSVSDVKRYIDVCAMNKLNVFHWHIMDDQGIRIEIKSHPELNSIGSIRPHCKKDTTRFDEGFYTQAEIKDIVVYAQTRHINIEPELETPGHDAAWLASLPGLSCTSVVTGSQRVACMHSNNENIPSTICVGKPYTYQIMSDVIVELTALFPFRYVHIGGDEVNSKPWKTCIDCLKLMKDSSSAALPLDTGNLHNVQTFYLRKIERLLAAKGKKVVGWTEMGLLSPNSVLQDYIGGVGRKIVNGGHEAIFAEASGLYLDSYQCGINEPKVNSWMGHITLEKVYNYNPPTATLPANKKALVLGIEACLWSENNNDTTVVEYRMLPRLYSVAEAAWTEESRKDFKDFQTRLYYRIGELDFLKYHYCPLATPGPTSDISTIRTTNGSVVLNAGFGSEYYYWNDEKKSTTSSISVTKSGVYKVHGYIKGTCLQRVFNVEIQ